jgi:hypothetical protein
VADERERLGRGDRNRAEPSVDHVVADPLVIRSEAPEVSGQLATPSEWRVGVRLTPALGQRWPARFLYGSRTRLA